jgi:cell division protease FtsH
MVEQFGMSPKIGPMAVSQAGAQFLEPKFPWDTTRETSEEFARIADEEVARFVTDAYDRARRILSEHEAALRAVADELKRTEVLDGDALRVLVQKTEAGTSGQSGDTPEPPGSEELVSDPGS